MNHPEEYVRWLAVRRTFAVPPADAAREYTLAWFDEEKLAFDSGEPAGELALKAEAA